MHADAQAKGTANSTWSTTLQPTSHCCPRSQACRSSLASSIAMGCSRCVPLHTAEHTVPGAYPCIALRCLFFSHLNEEPKANTTHMVRHAVYWAGFSTTINVLTANGQNGLLLLQAHSPCPSGSSFQACEISHAFRFRAPSSPFVPWLFDARHARRAGSPLRESSLPAPRTLSLPFRARSSRSWRWRRHVRCRARMRAVNGRRAGAAPPQGGGAWSREAAAPLGGG